MKTLIFFNKPFQVLSQFSDGSHSKTTLADYVQIPGVYPAGRLDYHSEGLLLLTNDGQLQHRIAHPQQKLPKVYWVLVEGCPTTDALNTLQTGVHLKDGLTAPAQASLMDEPVVWHRDLPPKYQSAVPCSWLKITIEEGRNRQIRRMTAHVGHPTVRLIRTKIGPWSLDTLKPGEHRRLSAKQAWQDLS